MIVPSHHRDPPPLLGPPDGARASSNGTSCGAVGTAADSGAEPVAPTATSGATGTAVIIRGRALGPCITCI